MQMRGCVCFVLFYCTRACTDTRTHAYAHTRTCMHPKSHLFPIILIMTVFLFHVPACGLSRGQQVPPSVWGQRRTKNNCVALNIASACAVSGSSATALIEFPWNAVRFVSGFCFFSRTFFFVLFPQKVGKGAAAEQPRLRGLTPIIVSLLHFYDTFYLREEPRQGSSVIEARREGCGLDSSGRGAAG